MAKLLYERINRDYVEGKAGSSFQPVIEILSINDLQKGKRVECKTIGKMLLAESAILEAAALFRQILKAAAISVVRKSLPSSHVVSILRELLGIGTCPHEMPETCATWDETLVLIR